MIQATLAQYLLDNLATAMLWFDETLRLRAMNSSAETLLDISSKQGAGLAVDNILHDAPLCSKLLKRVQRRRYTVVERSMRLHLSSAKMITVDCFITPVHGEMYHNHLLVELMQVDQHLRIAREEHLLNQHQAARNVVRGLAHEIKNPLGGLRGAAQLLERELPDEELREYTRIIIGEADRLQALLNRMLVPNTFTSRCVVNIHEVLLRVKQLILSEAGQNVLIHCDFDPSLPELQQADSDQLIQATLNIMRNAVQAMDGHGEINLSTRICRQMAICGKRHKLVIQVDIMDNGPGIPPKLIDQIFYPMVTGRANGTGLGLSIAQSLINQHGGLIECSSSAGKTIFTLWLPVNT